MDWCFSFFRSIHCVCLRIQRMGHGESICVSCKVHWLVSTVDICFFLDLELITFFSYNFIRLNKYDMSKWNVQCNSLFFSRFLRCGFAFNLFDGWRFFLGPLQPFALMIDIYSMCEMKGWQWQSRFLYLNIDIYIEVHDNPARAQHSIYAANMHKSIVHCLHIYCEWTKAIFIAQSAYTEWKLQPIPID